MIAQEPLDVIIVPTDQCPCGLHPDALVDMLIYRTVPHGLFHKIEIVCDFSNKTYDAALVFMPQSS